MMIMIHDILGYSLAFGFWLLAVGSTVREKREEVKSESGRLILAFLHHRLRESFSYCTFFQHQVDSLEK